MPGTPQREIEKVAAEYRARIEQAIASMPVGELRQMLREIDAELGKPTYLKLVK